jgi:hypothetical protein
MKRAASLMQPLVAGVVLTLLAMFAVPAEAAPAAWAPNRTYTIRTLVTYSGITYECRQTHTSQVGWEPPKVYSLWMRPTPTTVDTWTVQTNYVVGSKVVWKGIPYKCIQAHVSQPDWAPNVATSLWQKAPVVSSCSGQADGTFCNDNSKCTDLDQCQAGACVGRTAVICLDGPICQVNACDPGTGTCKVTNKPAGTECGKLQYCDGAGACKTPKVVTAPVGPGGIEPPSSEDPVCQGGVSLGTLTTNSRGEQVWSGATYTDSQPPTPPATCREQVRFCDANDAEIPRVPESEINAAAAQTDSCPAVAPPDPALCGLDHSTLGGTCTKDADCGAGFVCGVLCADPLCLENVERRCGKVRADCQGIPADPQFCDPRVFRLCPDPEATGTATEDQAAAQLPNQTAPQPTAEIPPAEQLKVEPLPSISSGVCKAEEKVEKEQSQSQPPATMQAAAKMLTLGNNKWGVFVSPTFLEKMKVNFSADPVNEDFQVDTSASMDAGGFVYGNKVNVLNVSAIAVAKQCGANAGIMVKMFGERVASADLIQGFQAGFGPLNITDEGAGNNPDDTRKCTEKLTASFNQAGHLRRALFAARNLGEFFKTSGVSKDVCQRSNKYLNLGLNCNDPASYNNSHEIINAWKAEYQKADEEYTKIKSDLTFEKDKISASARFALVNLKEPFLNKGIEKTFPVFGVPVTLALDLQGNFTYKGNFELGVSYASDKPRSDVPGLGPFLSDAATVRIVAGPTYSPGVTFNVLAFAGVGVPAISVGIEGNVKLLSVDWPVDVRLATKRQATPDTRDVQASDFKGEEIPGMPPSEVAKWSFGYSWGAKLALAALNGQIDVAVRIKLLFAKKTIRWKLFAWKGLSKEFLLAGGSDKSSLQGFSGFGDYAPKVVYRKTQLLTAADAPAMPNDAAIYPDRLGDEPCVIIE